MTLLINAAVFTTLFGLMLIVRKLMAKKISAVMQYALWAVVVIKLIIPFGFESSISPLGLLSASDHTAVETVQIDNDAGTGLVANHFNTGTQHEADGMQIQTHTETANSNASQPAGAIITPNAAPAKQTRYMQPVSWTIWALIVWGIGVFIVGAVQCVCMVNLRRRVRHASLPVPARVLRIFEGCKKELGIRRHIGVSMQSALNVPFAMGVLHPVLVLPVGIESQTDEQIRHICLHELTHLKYGDLVAIALHNMLCAVYWFNPFVWLCFRLIRKDMETACDARVIGHVGKAARQDYIGTVLQFAVHEEKQRLYAAMGMADGRLKMEQRIRGMFRKTKTGGKTRIIATCIMVLMLAACVLTACQPTPEEVVVVGKGDGLSDLIQATPDASSGVSPSSVSPSSTLAQTNDALYTKLEVPKHWNLETTELGGKLNITADVDIELPGVSQLPAATASLSEFTQEDLDNIAEVLGVKGAEWTEIINVPTKEMIEQWIIEDRAEIANPINDIRAKKAKENLKAHEQLYIDAPCESEVKRTLTEFEMSEVEFYEGTTGVRFEATTMIDGQLFYFYAGNYFGKSVRSVRANFGSRAAGFYGTYIDKPYGVSLTKEQAAAQSSEIAKQLTDELKLCYVVPTGGHKREDMSRNWGWACVFMREINGCPTAYESTEIGSDMETTISEPIPYEKMVIVMDDMGMISFEWTTPMTIESIDNPDVTLLPFEEIAQRATAQIGQFWAYNAIEAKSHNGEDTSDPGCTAKVTKVELGLMRVAKADSDDYYYIPVWNFFTDLEHTDGYYERTGIEAFSWEDHDFVDEEGNSTIMKCSYPQAWGAVTINALDGSVIDRDLGY